MSDLLNSTEKPDWFDYPSDFLQVIRSEVTDVGPWQFPSGKWLGVRHKGLANRFPERSLVPFARRLDDDDIACWDKRKPESVVIVHDFAAPGWEHRAEFASFASWYDAAKAEAKDYDG